jgi:hypothetical protein
MKYGLILLLLGVEAIKLRSRDDEPESDMMAYSTLLAEGESMQDVTKKLEE